MRDGADNEECFNPDMSVGCPVGATYVLISSLKNSANESILSQRNKTSTGYEKEYEMSLFTPVLETVADQNDVADSENAQYSSTLPDVTFYCEQLGFKGCTPTSGTCGNDTACSEFLYQYRMLPKEMIQLIRMLRSGNFTSGDKFVDYAATELVQEYTMPGLLEITSKYLHTQPAESITAHCATSALPMININPLNDLSNISDCRDGIFGCGGHAVELCTPGEVCMLNHMVFLDTCSADKKICNVWTWGTIIPVQCDRLATVASSNIYLKRDNYLEYNRIIHYTMEFIVKVSSGYDIRFEIKIQYTLCPRVAFFLKAEQKGLSTMVKVCGKELGIAEHLSL